MHLFSRDVFFNVCCGNTVESLRKKISKLYITIICEGNLPVAVVPSHRASNAENVSIWWRHQRFCFVLITFITVTCVTTMTAASLFVERTDTIFERIICIMIVTFSPICTIMLLKCASISLGINVMLKSPPSHYLSQFWPNIRLSRPHHDNVVKWKYFPRYWPLCRELLVNSLTRASDTEIWCFLWSLSDKRLSAKSWRRWFKTPSRQLMVTVMI